MSRLAFLVVVGALLGVAAAWLFADQFDLARGAGIGVGVMLATACGAFAYVVARR